MTQNGHTRINQPLFINMEVSLVLLGCITLRAHINKQGFINPGSK